MIQIPELWKSSFSQATFNFSAWSDELTRNDAERIGEDFASGAWLVFDSTDQKDGQLVTIEAAPPSDAEPLVVAIQLSRFWTWELVRERQPVSRETVSSLLSTLVGIEWQLSIEASYSVPRDLLPARGIVTDLLGLQTRVKDNELMLTGAQFAVRDLSGGTISWFVDDLQSASSVVGKITRHTHEVVREDSLVEALQAAEGTLNQLILEKSEIRSSGICQS